jgi:hypothetical protein
MQLHCFRIKARLACKSRIQSLALDYAKGGEGACKMAVPLLTVGRIGRHLSKAVVGPQERSEGVEVLHTEAKRGRHAGKTDRSRAVARAYVA